MNDYQKRVQAQVVAWINGDSNHNSVDDECCPDFSCCEPNLFEKDRAKRIETHNKWARARHIPSFKDAK